MLSWLRQNQPMSDFFALLHPKVVHFPIALFMSALGFEIASLLFRREGWHQTALHISMLALCVTPCVIYTGLMEEERLHLNHPLLDRHRFFAFATLYTALGSLPVLWFLRKRYQKYFRKIFVVVLILCGTWVFLAGHYGGRMVYEYGVGIEN
jgi:uncharacterized membrane protein